MINKYSFLKLHFFQGIAITIQNKYVEQNKLKCSLSIRGSLTDLYSLSLSLIFHTQNVISLFLTLIFSIFCGFFNIFLASLLQVDEFLYELFGNLLWVDVIKFCVLKLLFFLFSLISQMLPYCIIKIVYKDVMLFYYIT